ncbi:MAG: GTPase HflX [Lachnospiraceae bacterium]|nr:GTPase HflX [Lachnospiraceae bacterium]
MYENFQKKEKLITVAVAISDAEKVMESLDELDELIATAGGEVIGRIIQNREQIHSGTYVGKGKLDEIREMLAELGADGIVCDDELSPVQMKNLEDALDTKVMDRTLIILDIFAKRAVTREGKVQVELAQLRYHATRLIGMRNLSRLGGGIGTRGPGEKKLEVDRRLIKERISKLRQEVRDMENHREVTRSARERQAVPVVAIVGYTNAGKSTLLNTLTDADVLEEDKLFATLDPTSRNLKLSDGQEIILTDTVGFIRKLPHHLIDAFRSTLEESKYADILIHVVDCSNPQMEEQMHLVYETLNKLGVGNKPIITVFNKIDLLDEERSFKDFSADVSVQASIKNRIGLDALEHELQEILRRQSIYIEKTFGYDEAGKISFIRKYGQLLKEEYRDAGIYVEAYISAEHYGKLIQ